MLTPLRPCAAAWRGIVLPSAESRQHITDADAILTELERHAGVEAGATEITPSIETAAGIWHIREIITASSRIRQVCIDEAELSASLGIVQGDDPDPFVYARGRLCIEATAAGVQPIAVADPMGLGTENLSHDDLAKIATDARNLGFKGMVCSHPVWINPINEAYTPTESLVDYYTQVREVFAQALAAGTAAAPFAGRMIDVPVDEWAKDVLAMSAACATRDAAKQAALEKARIWQEAYGKPGSSLIPNPVPPTQTIIRRGGACVAPFDAENQDNPVHPIYPVHPGKILSH